MAVRNLVDNAVSYSDPGARVTASVTCKDDVVSIAVLDQGIGIDTKDQERIFERFYRTDPARARETGGTGSGPEHRQARRASARRRRRPCGRSPPSDPPSPCRCQRFEESE